MDHSTWELALVILIGMLDFAAAARAIWRSQGVERTLAWLFAIVAFPALGALAYFLLTNPSVGRTTARKKAATHAARDACFSARKAPFAEDIPPLLRLATNVTGLRPTEGNEVELLAESDEAFRQIEEALRGAERFIWAEYYIIRRDETGRRFLDILEERARAGIEVRLLFDAVGSMQLDGDSIAGIKRAGGKAEAFHPLNLLHRRWAMHLRNHRKLVIVDGALGFTGGMNIGDEYSGRARKRGGLHFKDSHLLIRGPAVNELAEVFVEDWAFATQEILELPPATDKFAGATSIVAILPSGPDQEYNATAQVYFGALGQAMRSVYVTSPYFIPDEPTQRALACAALRGVDVRLLVPALCDVMLVGLAARSYIPALVRAGVRVFEYLPTMLHAKTIVVDGEFSLVGSANLDIRSFRLNFELGALVMDSTFGRTLEARFYSDLAQSKELTLKSLASRGVVAKMQERAARLLSPLM